MRFDLAVNATEHPIELVQDHPILYNLRVPEHKDAQLMFLEKYCRNISHSNQKQAVLINFQKRMLQS